MRVHAAVGRGPVVWMSRRFPLGAACLALIMATGCSEPSHLPDSGFIYLSRDEVAAAIESLAVPLDVTETMAPVAVDSCACALWNGTPRYIFTSPVVPGAMIGAVSDDGCNERSVRRRERRDLPSWRRTLQIGVRISACGASR